MHAQYNVFAIRSTEKYKYKWFFSLDHSRCKQHTAIDLTNIFKTNHLLHPWCRSNAKSENIPSTYGPSFKAYVVLSEFTIRAIVAFYIQTANGIRCHSVR